MTFETSIDKLNMRIRAVYVSGQSDLGLRLSTTMHYVSKQCEYCASNSNQSSLVHLIFEERDFCVSVVAQTRTNVR